MPDALRVAILTASDQLPAWQHKLINGIATTGQITINLHLADDRLLKQAPLPQTACWHMQLDRKHFTKPPYAEALKPRTALPVPPPGQLSAWMAAQGDSQHPSASELLLWFSPHQPPKTLYPHFPAGIWMLVHGPTASLDDRLLGHREFARLEGILRSALLIKRTADEAGFLYRQTHSMAPALSIARGRNQHFWKLATFMNPALRDLTIHGQKAFFKERIQQYVPKNGCATRLIVPGHWEAAANIGRHGGRWLHKQWKKLNYREQWILLMSTATDFSLDINHFKKVIPPKDRFWADPFLISEGGKNYLFFEELLYETEKGHICMAEIGKEGEIGTIEKVLERPYHLSYPFVFRFEGNWYMIPEACESGAIQLFQANRFPHEWQHKMDIMQEVEAMDTTLVQHNGKWWLFTSMAKTKGASHHDELFLFFADSPLSSSWQSHAKNPVISDVSRARSGGRIFEQDGHLIRPSQDCSHKYGFGFHLNEIEVLTEKEYRERSILHIRPDRSDGLRRTHSYAHLPGLTVIDGLIQRRRVL